MYGKELIIDLHDCETPFTRETITRFMEELCDLIEMERMSLHFWDYDTEEEKAEAPDHLAGTSAVQFISTSNITIHTLDKLKAVYLNVFTCLTLDVADTLEFCKTFWQGHVARFISLERI